MIVNGNLKFHTLGAGELQNAVIENFASDPGTNVAGHMYYNTDTNVFKYNDGTQWVEFGTSGGLSGLQTEVDAIETASGGIFDTDGTYVPAVLDALTNVTSSTSLANALSQIDAALEGSDTLEELNDTVATTTSDAIGGDLLAFNGTAWDNTGFTSLATGNLLQWDGSDWGPIAPATIGGNAYETFLTDVGTSIVADTIADTASLLGGTNGGIQTTAVDDAVTFDWKLADLATESGATVVGGDFLPWTASGDDATVTGKKISWTKALTDLDIVTAAADGILTRIAADTYASRTITASVVDGEEGITITDGNGISGNPTIGLDIINQNDIAAVAEVTDVLLPGEANITAGQYWTLNSTTVDYYVWYTIGLAGVDPAPAGKTAIVVDITAADIDSVVATKTAAAIDSIGAFGAISAGSTVTVTNAVAGAVVDAANVDIGGAPTWTITTQGTDAIATASDSIMVYDASANENLKVSIASLANSVGSSLTFNELSNIDDAAHVAGTGYLLVGDGAGGHVVEEVTPTAPANFIEAIQDMINTFIVTNGTHSDITVTYDDAGNGLDFAVDDSYLRNTGDTLDSGTLTVASGATVAIATGASLTIVDAPTSGTDATNKDYVDSIAAGLDPKASVRVATDAALPAYTASGAGVLTANAVGILTVDGVATALGDRILVKNEGGGTAIDNGIYEVSVAGEAAVAFVLSRAPDADTDAEVTAGNHTFSTEGSVNADTGWILVTNDPIVVDTTAQTWSQYTGAGSFNAGLGLGQSGSTIFLKTHELTTAVVAATDTLVFHDQNVTITGIESGDRKTTVSSFLTSMAVLTNVAGENAILASDGVLVADSSTTARVELDFNGLTNLASVGADILAFGDASATFGSHIKRTVTEFISDHNIFTGGTGGALTASNGVKLTTNNLAVSIDGLTLSHPVVGADLILFDDGANGTNSGRTFTDVMADLDIVNLGAFSSAHMISRTADNTYAEVTLAVDGAGANAGLTLTNGAGAIPGAITFGLDIVNMDAAAAAPAVTDTLIVNDGSNNEKVTIAQLADAVAGATSTDELSDVTAASTVAGQVMVSTGSTYTPALTQFISTFTSGTTWAAVHNLGQKFVNVTVYDSLDNVIIPQAIVATSTTTTTITFNTAISGTVVISSVPNVAIAAGTGTS